MDLDLETRTKEITQIASSISELADLFRDLGNLIVEQGTVLDSVEYNVQMTVKELSGAVEELKTAQQYAILFLFMSCSATRSKNCDGDRLFRLGNSCFANEAGIKPTRVDGNVSYSSFCSSSASSSS